MKNFKQIYKLNIFAAIIFSVAINSFAAETNGKDAYKSNVSKTITSKSGAVLNYSVLVKDLSQRLKVDLSETNLKVNLRNVEENRLTNNLVEIKGQAFCVLPNDNMQLPINFEAKFDVVKQSVADVQYVFVESSYAAPEAEEEILMRELMKQVSRDYKTDQITIAIDGFEKNKALNNQSNLKGIGEIRIGEVEWNKINFDVVLGADKKATKIVYSIK